MIRRRMFVINRLPIKLRIIKDTDGYMGEESLILMPMTRAKKVLQSRLYKVRSISRAKKRRHGALTFCTVSSASSGGALWRGISIRSR